MTFNFHGSWENQTGHNAPMYATNSDMDKQQTVNASINAWINAGASRCKILMGLAFFGHSFNLTNSSNSGVGAEINGAGLAGPYTQDPGSLTYLELCQEFAKGGWKKIYDRKRKSPYAVKGDQWISYDNVNSIKLKTQYAIDKELGGVMVWPANEDDRLNSCGAGRMALLNAIDSVIKNRY